MKGESKTSDRSVTMGIILFIISTICFVASIAWVLTNAFSYIYMIPVWVIGILSFVIMFIQRQANYYRDVKNIEDVNDPKRGINDDL